VWQRFVSGGEVQDVNHGVVTLGALTLREFSDQRAREVRGEGA
jgi:hypothetical protein